MSTTGISLGRAHSVAAYVGRESSRLGTPIERLTPVGGLRRYAPAVEQVSLIGVVDPARQQDALDALTGLGGPSSALRRDDNRLAFVTERGPVEVILTAPEHAGTSLAWHTGTRQHRSMLVDRGRARGLRFEPNGLWLGGRVLECPTEEMLFGHLGLPFVPPELREGRDELTAADRGAIPPLLTTLHLRGDLHCHTHWSDGRDTVRMMAETAHTLGYAYLAITDHSHRSAAARTLAPDDVARQRAEIDAAQSHVPDVALLHGVEVEIMPDGTLDFEDDLLAQFDIVLASLHDDAGQSPEELLARYVRTMEHPLVTVITHPANRQPAGHDGYALDFDRLFDVAAATGTALEVDGAPSHLDLDGELARRATAAGVTLVVDSDAHRADALARQAEFGVGTARRGWVEPRHVLNARSERALRDFIRLKRG